MTIFKYKLVYVFGNFAVFVRISTQYILQQIKLKTAFLIDLWVS